MIQFFQSHKSVAKGTGLTKRIERFNCTMKQQISRLVRSTLSFSKKLSNHVGAIWAGILLFIIIMLILFYAPLLSLGLPKISIVSSRNK